MHSWVLCYYENYGEADIKHSLVLPAHKSFVGGRVFIHFHYWNAINIKVVTFLWLKEMGTFELQKSNIEPETNQWQRVAHFLGTIPLFIHSFICAGSHSEAQHFSVTLFLSVKGTNLRKTNIQKMMRAN